ncbi:interferon-inducible GTPase 5-like, partial [Hemiscyllium ocellatum]|uniref:interferon-inducible GTPase 5-like n=1 Tax=Hemiscyllium ocellatum TaxID=170820 RepID=UPI002966D23B
FACYNLTDVKHLINIYRHGGLSALQSETEKISNKFKNVKINIAVMGASGVGKSTLVNALRGVDNNDKDAAPIDVVESTMERKCYRHPTVPNVIYWDTPGVGSLKVKVNKFLKDTKFSDFDFGLLVSDHRFREEDEILVKAMKKAGKPIFFVRSKIDQSLLSERKKPGYSKEQVFHKISNYCSSSLAQMGVKDERIFLISCEDLDKYEFPELRRAVDAILPEIKRNVFLFSLPNRSIDIIKKKQEHLKFFIRGVTVVSAGYGAVPIPGLSLACDLALITSALLYMHNVLGLKTSTLEKLAKSLGKSVSELQANTNDTWIFEEIDPNLVQILLMRDNTKLLLTAAEPVLDFVPIFGTIFGVTSSAYVTYTVLTEALEDMVNAAKTVLKNAYDLA